MNAVDGTVSDDVPADADERMNRLVEIENDLIRKIASTPPETVEGALCVIEALDRYEFDTVSPEDWWTQLATEGRRQAVATLRRCLAAAAPTEADPHAAWLAEWLEVTERSSRAYCAIDVAGPLPEHIQRDFDRCEELVSAIKGTPPRTAEGVAAQLRLLYHLLFTIQVDAPADAKALLASTISFIEREVR
ncbi:MAG: hypothetical protein R3F54_14400 [Alphaproteobacteria bacterium]